MTVSALAHYLEVHARWAANTHPAYEEFHADLRALHARLEIATHRRRAPTKAGAQCFECGGVLERRIDENGLEETQVTCRVCREVYEPARYNLALKAAAEAASRIEVDGEQWATVQALATELDRSENTIKVWRRDELVRSLAFGGVTLLAVADAQREHEARATRVRRAG